MGDVSLDVIEHSYAEQIDIYFFIFQVFIAWQKKKFEVAKLDLPLELSY